jgi:hypothetical protein
MGCKKQTMLHLTTLHPYGTMISHPTGKKEKHAANKFA